VAQRDHPAVPPERPEVQFLVAQPAAAGQRPVDGHLGDDLPVTAHEVVDHELVDGALADEREELGDAVVAVARREMRDTGAVGGVVGPVGVPADMLVEVPEDGGRVALAERPVDAGDDVCCGHGFQGDARPVSDG
jgi:hypothetical protein